MKLIITALAALFLAAIPAIADEDPPKFDQPTDINVPTGKDVPGATSYVLQDGKVVQIPDPYKPGNPLFWDTVSPPSGGGSE